MADAIEKAIEALQSKADFTHNQIFHERMGFIRQLKHMLSVLEADPKAMTDMSYDLNQLQSSFDSMIEHEVEYRHKLEMICVVVGVQRREGELQ